MKKCTLFLLILAVLVGTLVSCGGGGGGEISVFYYTYADAYISSVRSAMDNAFRTAMLNYNNYDANNYYHGRHNKLILNALIFHNLP